ncbi:adenylate/guanylate cyclase domain-containing protein [Spirochaetia bacterium 38H-sp]|uniref:Adenylate/guanylate cyclase domain-containing protein n=1 Tax=Rarispira pelagica TaxID=3141764 RepID=A0ABU9U8N5_9SPIR
MAKRSSITRKVIVIISVTLILGIGLITYLFTRNIIKTINDSTVKNLEVQTDVLFNAIENMMMPGDAALASAFFSDIAEDNPGSEILLFRADGRPAFTDTSTIEKVNAIIGTERFDKNTPRVFSDIESLSADEIAYIMQPFPHTFKESYSSDNRTYIRVLTPLINLPKCTLCHGSDHTVRGIVEINEDITDSIMQQRDNLVFAGVSFVVIVVLLGGILTFFMRKSVLDPVREIGRACTAVTAGDFDVRIDLSQQDEIGQLAETVNTMVKGLYERFALSKFVSRSTISAIASASEEGEKQFVTMLFSDVRSFTNYSSSREPATVVSVLNKLLSLQTDIIHKHGGDIDKYVGDEVVATFIGEGAELRAARAATEIVEVLSARQGELDNLMVGLGIHYGEVIMGRVGSSSRADYTVIGDTVNLASRLCNSAKPGMILISSAFYEKIKASVDVTGPYELRVKGKEDVQKVYGLKKVLQDAGKKEEEA